MIKLLFCIAMIITILSPAVRADQGIITVNYPPDRTVMEFGLLGVSLKVPQGSVNLIRVNVNDKEKATIIPDSEFECFTLPLAAGINKINIISFKNNSQVDDTGINVFRRSELSSQYIKPPPGFSKDFFHVEDRSLCAPCHTLEPGMLDRKPVDISAFPSGNLTIKARADAAASTCYSCHKALTAYPFIHGPAAVWSCLSCHEAGAFPKYSVSRPDARMCYTCHIKQKEKWEAQKYFHGPFNTGKCAICHNPHASDYPFILAESTWDLCVNCHTDKGSGMHILEKYVIYSSTYFHPTRGVPDPLRNGQELTCASCHDSHASDSPKLWKFKVESGFALCKICHSH